MTRWAYATQVFPQNLEYIIRKAKDDYGINLDYLSDNMEYNAEDGEDTFVVMAGTEENPYVATFTDMTRSAFEESWRFVTEQNAPDVFRLIERKL